MTGTSAGSALVLGSGGVAGVAWELGVLAGLAAAGVDLTSADLVIGTSAGAVVGAQITSGTPIDALYRAQLEPRAGDTPARLSLTTIARLGWAYLRSSDPQQARARMGALALSARTPTEEQRRAVLASRLPSHEWPDRDLLVTAVDAHSGEFAVFDRDDGVSLVDAVGASCAVPGVWPPVTIDGRRYIDGGTRSPVNADLATGHDPVVVLAPNEDGFGTRLRTQVAQLRQTAKVAVVRPDHNTLRAFGRNQLDPARRAPSARAGFEQAAACRDEIAAIWAG
jgi:NTE family protein